MPARQFREGTLASSQCQDDPPNPIKSPPPDPGCPVPSASSPLFELDIWLRAAASDGEALPVMAVRVQGLGEEPGQLGTLSSRIATEAELQRDRILGMPARL
jgi:hypothetical protein